MPAPRDEDPPDLSRPLPSIPSWPPPMYRRFWAEGFYGGSKVQRTRYYELFFEAPECADEAYRRFPIAASYNSGGGANRDYSLRGEELVKDQPIVFQVSWCVDKSTGKSKWWANNVIRRPTARPQSPQPQPLLGAPATSLPRPPSPPTVGPPGQRDKGDAVNCGGSGRFPDWARPQSQGLGVGEKTNGRGDGKGDGKGDEGGGKSAFKGIRAHFNGYNHKDSLVFQFKECGSDARAVIRTGELVPVYSLAQRKEKGQGDGQAGQHDKRTGFSLKGFFEMHDSTTLDVERVFDCNDRQFRVTRLCLDKVKDKEREKTTARRWSKSVAKSDPRTAAFMKNLVMKSIVHGAIDQILAREAASNGGSDESEKEVAATKAAFHDESDGNSDERQRALHVALQNPSKVNDAVLDAGEGAASEAGSQDGIDKGTIMDISMQVDDNCVVPESDGASEYNAALPEDEVIQHDADVTMGKLQVDEKLNNEEMAEPAPQANAVFDHGVQAGKDFNSNQMNCKVADNEELSQSPAMMNKSEPDFEADAAVVLVNNLQDGVNELMKLRTEDVVKREDDVPNPAGPQDDPLDLTMDAQKVMKEETKLAAKGDLPEVIERLVAIEATLRQRLDQMIDLLQEIKDKK